MKKLFLIPPHAADYLGLKTGTLARWRWSGKGPKYHKIGGRVFYLTDDLDDFISNGKCIPISCIPFNQGDDQ